MIETLVVDDEYIVRKGFIATMPWEQNGIRIAGEASNGVKALEFMRQRHIDLLITDLSMPVMNGFDLMRQVSDEFPQVKIVVLSCHEDFKYIQDALRLGAIDYIAKTELDDDSMEAALNRIAGRISNKRNNGDAQPPKQREAGTEWSEEREERLLAHCNRWLPLHWVVNDEEFGKLSEELVSIGPSIPRLLKAAHYLLIEWNRTIPLKSLPQQLAVAEEIGSWDDWAAFLAGFRKMLREQLRLSAYPKDVVERIFKAVEWIQADLSPGMTQRYLAQQVKMNRGYFSKAFKDLIGTNFQDYMKDKRIDRAKTLLLQSNKPIAVIAEECGFMDSRYFSRQFREETGKLPSEYRQVK